MKPLILKRLPIFFWSTGKPYEAWPQGAKCLPLSWVAVGCFSNLTLSLIYVLSILVADQGRKFNI